MGVPMIEIIKLALNGGSFALLLLIALGAYKLIDRWAPQIIAAINGNTAAFATLSTKIDAIGGQLSETRQDVRHITGEHAAVTAERVPSMTPGRGFASVRREPAR